MRKYTFTIVSRLILLKDEKCFTPLVENTRHTFYIEQLFSENLTDNVEKMVDPDRFNMTL
jgi:hypothetical protein